MDKKPAILEILLNAMPAFLALAVPIFFLPLTTEFFEFNKLALIAVASGFMLLLWVTKMLYDKRVEVTKSPADFPLIAIGVVTLLATIFSLHKVSSLFGSQGRWFPSLFGVVVLLVLYYVIATNISTVRNIKTIIDALILGITISSLVALLGYFGIALGTAAYLQIPNFTLTGSAIVASIIAALAVTLSLTRIVSNAGPPAKMLFVTALGINFLAVALLGTLPAWVVLVVGLLVSAYFTRSTRWVENRSYLSITAVLVLAFIALLVMPSTRGVLVNEGYPMEIRLSARESWLVVSSTIRDFPVLGTGPSTFGLNYTRYKPLSVNGSAYWNIRFDKPYSEVFTVMNALGVVGIAVMLAFGMKTLRYSLKTKEQMTNNSVTTALAVGYISMLMVMVVAHATVTMAFLLVLFLALTTANRRLEADGEVSNVLLSLSSLIKGPSMSLAGGKKEVFQYIVAVPLVVMAVGGGYYLSKQILGEYYMRKSISAAQENNGSLAYQMQQNAITANPVRDGYHNAYANTNLALANTIASRGEVSDEEKATIQVLIAQSIRSARVATEVLNPLSSTNWETRSNIYRALIGVADDAPEWAIRSYNTAVQLDPTNPRLRLNLGGIYYAAEDYLSAANLFNQAASLKSDYANAHYNLAQALMKLERFPQAQRELEITKRLVQPESADFERIVADLEALSREPAVAGAEDKPSVEELEGAEVEEPAEQEPLVNVGEEGPVEDSELEIEEPLEVEEDTEAEE
jgi:tetratricopeptide (TPR) repeat protein